MDSESPAKSGSVDRAEVDRHCQPPEVDLKTETKPREEGLPPGVRKVVIGEKEEQEWSSSVDQEDADIKDEQEEVDIAQLISSPAPVTSEEDEEKPESSHLHRSQTEEVSDCVGGPESDPDLQPDGKTSSSSDTDVSDADECEQSHEPAAPQASGEDDEKPFSCSVCGERFHHSRNLSRHLRTHTGEKPVSCSQCGKRFVDSGNLQRHMGIHTEKKPFSCSECGRDFKDKTTLINHRRTHTGEKPFTCKFCGKTFTHSGNLKQHLCVHTREKPYSCSRCAKTFGRNGDLNSHMLIHTGEKAFSCSECGRRFTHSRSLKQHLKSHAGEKAFSSSLCGKRFHNGAHVKKHMRTHVTNSFRNITGNNISCSAD